MIVTPEDLRALAEKLRYSDEMLFDFMFCLTGVDMVSHLLVVYHLASTFHGHEMVMKVRGMY